MNGYYAVLNKEYPNVNLVPFASKATNEAYANKRAEMYFNLAKAVRALTHLLDNALKFTTEGTVTLKVAVDMDKMQAIYTVEDTGAGIEESEREHVFEPYVKLNQFFEGQGIGLTVARSIARRLDGDVVLDTTYEGPGSRFVLTLPI